MAKLGEKFEGLMAKLRLKIKIKTDSLSRTKEVPKGFFPVYVGEGRKLYIVPISLLSTSLFQALLKEFEDEIWATRNQPITLPCPTEKFEYILRSIELQKYKYPCKELYQ